MQVPIMRLHEKIHVPTVWLIQERTRFSLAAALPSALRLRDAAYNFTFTSFHGDQTEFCTGRRKMMMYTCCCAKIFIAAKQSKDMQRHCSGSRLTSVKLDLFFSDLDSGSLPCLPLFPSVYLPRSWSCEEKNKWRKWHNSEKNIHKCILVYWKS